MANLLSNPSLEGGAGNPRIPTGWANVNLDVGDTLTEAVIIHSGAESLEWAVGATTDEGIRQGITAAAGSFIQVEMWSYGDGAAGFTIGGLNATTLLVQHSTTAFNVATPHTVGFSYTQAVFRVIEANPDIYILADAGAGAARYIDDISVVECDPISLTVTPASQANSAEATGLRVDGLDTCIQPITDIKATRGRIVFQYTPRHDAADVALFGELTSVIGAWYGDATNWIMLDWSAANTIRLQYNCGVGVLVGLWNATGAIVPGVTYVMDIRYTGAIMQLRVDGVVQITINNNVNFVTLPGNAYWLTDELGVQQNDATVNEP